MDNFSQKFGAFTKKIAAIATSTPPELLEPILPLLMDCDLKNWQISKAKALAIVHSPQLKADITELFELWETGYPDLQGCSVALAISSALESIQRSHQTHLDLVWTGPKSKVFPFRRTDQALLQLINSATEKLLIVSFAVYKIKMVSDALEKAVQRGVRLDIVVEDSEESGGKIAFSGKKAFGKAVQNAANFFTWPIDKRPATPEGAYGSLHAKVAVADRDVLFISSANLTEYAMALNMEMGVLIRGGEMPGNVTKHFDELIDTRQLVREKI